MLGRIARNRVIPLSPLMPFFFFIPIPWVPNIWLSCFYLLMTDCTCCPTKRGNFHILTVHETQQRHQRSVVFHHCQTFHSTSLVPNHKIQAVCPLSCLTRTPVPFQECTTLILLTTTPVPPDNSTTPPLPPHSHHSHTQDCRSLIPKQALMP